MKGNSARIKCSGGGINSRVNKSVSVRTGASATGVRPAAVSQFGSAIGNKATDAGKLTYRGEKYQTATPISVPLGNEVATNVGKGGPAQAERSCGAEANKACQPHRERLAPPGIRFPSLGQTARTRAVGGRSD
jgi:hypothetical protein